MNKSNINEIEEIINKIRQQEASMWHPEDGLNIEKEVVVYRRRSISDQSGYNLDYDILTLSFPKSELEQLIEDAIKFGKSSRRVKGSYDDVCDHSNDYSGHQSVSTTSEGNAFITLELELSKGVPKFSCYKTE